MRLHHASCIDELFAAFGGAPHDDYEQLRDDLDDVADPGPKDWYEWAARTDRHIRRLSLYTLNPKDVRGLEDLIEIVDVG